MADTLLHTQTNVEAWFDDLVSELRVHQLQLETQTANDELKKMYDTFFTGNADKIAFMGKTAAQQHFVTRIIFDYLELLKSKLPNKVAFNFNDSEVLVWAEINDDDTESEKNLLSAEAVINAKYHPFGFDMVSTVVEVSDNLKIPNHYKVVKN
jgi:hypothetical protein